MGMSNKDSGGEGGLGATLSEINITPLVDVMLVLLTIFMVASSVETIQVAKEKERLLKQYSDTTKDMASEEKIRDLEERLLDQEEILSRQRRMLSNIELSMQRCEEIEEQLEDRSRNVPINLPRVDSEAINLAEQKKLVLVMTRELKLFVGDTLIADCAAQAQAAAAQPGAPAPAGPEDSEVSASYLACLTEVKAKLQGNKKLQDDKECYLKVDRELNYGKVLALMSAIRQAGITKFGLVSIDEQ